MYAGNQEYLEVMHIQYLGMDLYKQWLSFAA